MHASPHHDRATTPGRPLHRPRGRRRRILTARADRRPSLAAGRDGIPPSAAGTRARAGDVVARRYLLQGALATRRTTTVWMAHDRLLARPVVLKHLTSRSDAGLRAAVGEARSAAAVSNRHVVAVHDVVLDPVGGAWIVMEALDGVPLAVSIARTGGLPLPTVVTVADALVDALTALHGAGVVHRDVKPGNVQLCRDGRVVLLDLGVAAGDEPRDHPPRDVAGTIEYLAPEVVLSARSSPASDLYALGATLFCAVEGVVPFRLTCVQDLVEHASDPPGPPACPRAGWLGPLLTGLLQPDPRDRWGLAEVRRSLAAAGAPTAERLSVG